MGHNADSTRLYRIMDFTRVVQIFERGELYFAHPGTWDDPYEKIIKHTHNHTVFAQCWSGLANSDAMWRIYSQNGTGVRISTTVGKLNAIMSAACKKHGYKKRVEQVQYLSQGELSSKAKQIADSLNSNFHISLVADALCMKREAFRHESEWRAMFYSPKESRYKDKKGIFISVDPHEFIDRILLDPRAPEELVAAFQFYFKEKLKFEGSVGRSRLYQVPVPYVVRDSLNEIVDL